MQFHIENMTCGQCAKSVTKVIISLDPDASVDADPSTRRIKVQTSAANEDVQAALMKAGWDASLR